MAGRALVRPPAKCWRCLRALAAVLAVAAAVLSQRDAPGQTVGAGPAGVAAYRAGAFREWTALASAQTVSPAHAADGDLTYTWTAPDGRTIRTVVRLPHKREPASAVTLDRVPEGKDSCHTLAFRTASRCDAEGTVPDQAGAPRHAG